MDSQSQTLDPQSEIDLLPYAGRWIALAGEQVAGVGHTAAEALRLARRNRPRERFKLRFVEAPGGEPLALSPLLERLRPLLDKQEMPVYLVGGAVRDALLGRVSHDLDFLVPEGAIKLAFKVANSLNLPAYVLDQERDTGRAVLPDEGTMLDFARFRGESLESDLYDRDVTINAIALPAAAQTTTSLIDPHRGRQDLAAGLLRPVHAASFANDPVRALRAVRLAITLGFTLTAEAEQAIVTAGPLLPGVSPERVRDELVKLLETAAPDEAIRLMDRFGLLAAVLPEVAALKEVAQSPPHHEPVLAHTISVLRCLIQIEAALEEKGTQGNLPPQDRGEEPGGTQEIDSLVSQEEGVADGDAMADVRRILAAYKEPLQNHLARPVHGGLDGRLTLRLGTLLHDVGKARTHTIEADGRIRFLGHDGVGAKMAAEALERLRFSKEAIIHVERIVAGHMRPLLLTQAPEVSRRAVYRFFLATQSAGLDIGLLALADHLATYNGPGPAGQWARLLQVVQTLYQNFFEEYEETIQPRPFLNGLDIMELLAIPPGPEVGQLLRLLEEGQAAGEIRSKEEAIQLVKEKGDG
jgi:putative nucleotidyltransferase with HDIG domain